MKRFIAIIAVIALAAGLAAAAPTIYGSNGLFRVINARNAGKMNFGIGARRREHDVGVAEIEFEQHLEIAAHFFNCRLEHRGETGVRRVAEQRAIGGFHGGESVRQNR